MVIMLIKLKDIAMFRNDHISHNYIQHTELLYNEAIINYLSDFYFLCEVDMFCR